MFFKTRLGSGKSSRVVLLDDRIRGPEFEEKLLRARDAQFVGGHFGMETLERIRGDAFTFTILRDPGERLRSIYGHLRTRTDGNPLGDKVRTMSLIDFFESNDPDILQWSDNVMARMLAFGHAWNSAAGTSAEELSKRAISRATTLDHVAFLEKLDDDIAPVAAVAGLNYKGTLSRENVTAIKAPSPPPAEAVQPMTPQERELAKKRIAADLAVYDTLRERTV